MAARASFAAAPRFALPSFAGQVITQETIDFMRKLDVKEIHGYDAGEGLKLVTADALAKIGGAGRPSGAAMPKAAAAKS